MSDSVGVGLFALVKSTEGQDRFNLVASSHFEPGVGWDCDSDNAFVVIRVNPPFQHIIDAGGMPFIFVLHPEREGGMVNAYFFGEVDLFDVVFVKNIVNFLF